MPLDQKGRIKRARKAGLASAKKQREKIIPRDKGLILAYLRLTDDGSLSKEKTIQAIQFLKSINLGPNPPERISVLTHLATAVDISKDRLQRILRDVIKRY